MSYYLLIAPTVAEFTVLKSTLVSASEKEYAGIKGLEFTTPKGKVFAIHGKVGKVNTAFDIGRISAVLDLSGIINIGCAGSLSDSLRKLDVVVATKVACYDNDLTAFGLPYGQMDDEPLYYECDLDTINMIKENETNFDIKTGLIISADRFATKNNIGKEILEKFDNPIACDMESSAVAQCAHNMGIPFYIIRCISDEINETKENKDSYEEFATVSARLSVRTALHFLNFDPDSVNN